ncbi:Pet8p [Paramicrosporidium saccamoebae]|uniref:Pet8p n=1 Tax=Paramicrosporidium saccamoebae TaxID=1246581 RepID=A0A2H9TIT4_9FUNG|nr:Pet8p [Paramicrosporidium saccamoebae]
MRHRASDGWRSYFFSTHFWGPGSIGYQLMHSGRLHNLWENDPRPIHVFSGVYALRMDGATAELSTIGVPCDERGVSAVPRISVRDPPSAHSHLICGVAGTSVDIILFPLDTLKTRLQSAGGLAASGGLRSLYSGLSSAVLGSAPGAALFFLTYESMKQAFSILVPTQRDSPCVHLVSSSLAEIVALRMNVHL